MYEVSVILKIKLVLFFEYLKTTSVYWLTNVCKNVSIMLVLNVIVNSVTIRTKINVILNFYIFALFLIIYSPKLVFIMNANDFFTYSITF